LETAQVEGITEETSLESLGISSLELVEILMTLEEEHDIHIDVDAVEAKESLHTVGDLLELGKQHGLGGKPSGGAAEEDDA
jgi:acyl carrier protein